LVVKRVGVLGGWGGPPCVKKVAGGEVCGWEKKKRGVTIK